MICPVWVLVNNILNDKERFTAQLSAPQSPNHADLKYRLQININSKTMKENNLEQTNPSY